MVVTAEGIECYSKPSIKQACLAENQAHFNQASDTPLLQAPLYGLFGPLGTGNATTDILKGHFQYPHVPIVQDAINMLKQCNLSITLGPICIQASDY